MSVFGRHAAPVLIGALALLTAVPPACAESERGSNEVEVFMGASLLDLHSQKNTFPSPLLGWAQSASSALPIPFPFPTREELGGSFVQGFRIAHRLRDRASLGVAFSIAPTHQLTVQTAFGCAPGRFCIASPSIVIPDFRDERKIVAYHYGLDLAYELTRGDVRPFLSLGGGGISYDVPGAAQTDFALTVGGGVTLRLGDADARVELVDHVTPDQFLTRDTEHDVHVRAGIVVHFH